MRFSTPAALLLLIVIPYFLWLGWPRLAYRRRRDVISLALRLLIIFCLVFGLAGLQTVQAADKLAVVFLVDASDSIDQNARTTATNYVREAMSKMTPDDRAGIVVFGKNALVERPLSSAKELDSITSAPIRLDTNLAEAMRLGMAMFPSEVAKRLVILSDGAETLGSALEAARLAAATNVQIDVVPLRRQPGPEVQIGDVRLPTSVNQGEIFDLGVTVESTVATRANLTILADGGVLQQKTVDLQVGTNNFVISLRTPRQGFSGFQVRVDPLGQRDTYYQNNELAGFTEVTGPPRILMISSKPEEIAALLPAMQQAGLQVDVNAPTDLPIGLAPLAAYKAVVLANVSATDLTDQRMKVLQSYVRDLGGGLVVIGGPNSYGLGGYYQTPLEETLPVEMQIKDQKRIPTLTMVYVIDRSGSMEMTGASGVTNLELAKEAARRSLNFLFERDRAGILSFDSNPQWLVPIQFVTNRNGMNRQIGALRPGGGTDIYAAVAEIARSVPSDPSTLKHVILLTDGGADSAGIVEMVREMREKHGITVTSIGIGVGVPPFMKDIAVAGGGTYYNLIDLQTIPQIFAAETVLATRSYLVEEEFTPVITASSQIMRGIDSTPTLQGYVATTAKPTATIVLSARVGAFNDPLLASWQYGLGRVVAWTSDAAPRWSQNWTSWTGFQRFWSQVIRSTIIEGLDNSLEARVEQRNGRSVLVVEARDKTGSFINSLSLDSTIVDPRLEAQSIKLQQVAPGRYEAEFEPQREGAYFIRVAGAGGIEQSVGVAQTTGWVLSYSPEYRLRETNMVLLDDLARMTGGRNVFEQPNLVFRHDIREESATTSLWPWLLLLATILLPLDIGVRRVVVTKTDLQKLRVWARKKLGISDRAQIQVTSARIAALKGAKVRATGVMPAETPETPSSETPAPMPAGERLPPPKPMPPPAAPRRLPTRPVAPPSAQQGTPQAPPIVSSQTRPAKPTEPKPVEPPPSDAGSSLAARLAEKRRQRKESD